MTFVNNDARLLERVEQAQAERKAAGLEGLTGPLEAVIVNVRESDLEAAVAEFLNFTGYDLAYAYADKNGKTAVLSLPGSADVLVKTRARGKNPFLAAHTGPKSEHCPEAGVETFVYRCTDLDKYSQLQLKRGVKFQSFGIVEQPHYGFMQTRPSAYTGSSIGLVQWSGKHDWTAEDAEPLTLNVKKPAKAHLNAIGFLDHSATRVQAEHRDDAVIEFMGLTDYDFAFAVHVDSMNSITNVARRPGGGYAQVFTSGIKPFESLDDSGPTEKFIHNYGLRVHHLAYVCQDIDDAYANLKADGLGFIVDVVGGPEDGLKQTFSDMSPTTFITNEYIMRYPGFDGFFAKSNVTQLTAATDKQ